MVPEFFLSGRVTGPMLNPSFFQPSLGQTSAEFVLQKETLMTNNFREFILPSAKQNSRPRIAITSNSFVIKKYENDTELAKYIWELKSQHKQCNISLPIYSQSSDYNRVTNWFNFCILEKLVIYNVKIGWSINGRILSPNEDMKPNIY